MAPASKPLILVVDPRRDVASAIEATLTEAGFAVVTASDGRTALDSFYAAPPRCIVLRHGLTGPDEDRSLVEEIKSDNVYGHLPVIAIIAQDELDGGIDWNTTPVDDYVIEPISGSDLSSRIQMCWARARRDVDANPLTGLPGNHTVTREAKRRLARRTPFGFAYLDLDSFKPYNDKYGFARGDEVLRMTARVLVNEIRSLDHDDAYVGHIGGDDFVFMTPPGLLTQACEEVNKNFDLIVPSFYDEEDRARLSIESEDRRGNKQVFPIMSSSIGAVDTSASNITHTAELFSRATEMKSQAKGVPGSSYCIDRRK